MNFYSWKNLTQKTICYESGVHAHFVLTNFFNKIEHRKLWLQDIVVIKVVGVDVEIFMCSGFDL